MLDTICDLPESILPRLVEQPAAGVALLRVGISMGPVVGPVVFLGLGPPLGGIPKGQVVELAACLEVVGHWLLGITHFHHPQTFYSQDDLV